MVTSASVVWATAPAPVVSTVVVPVVQYPSSCLVEMRIRPALPSAKSPASGWTAAALGIAARTASPPPSAATRRNRTALKPLPPIPSIQTVAGGTTPDGQYLELLVESISGPPASRWGLSQTLTGAEPTSTLKVMPHDLAI